MVMSAIILLRIISCPSLTERHIPTEPLKTHSGTEMWISVPSGFITGVASHRGQPKLLMTISLTDYVEQTLNVLKLFFSIPV